MPSLILNLLIIWFIGSLLSGRATQRRRQQMAQETETRRKRPPSRHLRRGLSGPLYQEEDDDEIESITLDPVRTKERSSFEERELEPRQPKTKAMAVSSWEIVTQETAPATIVSKSQPIDKLSVSSQDLLSPNNLVQSLILTQVLSEPRCRRTHWVR